MTLAAGALAAYAVWPRGPITPPLALVNGAVAVTFMVTAALLFEEREQRGTAILFALTGLCWLTFWVGVGRGGPLPLIDFLAGPLFAPLCGWALLRYPEARLDRSYERLLVAAGLVWVGAGHSALALIYEPRDPAGETWWPPTLEVGAAFLRTAGNVYWAGGGLLGAAYIAAVAVRTWRFRGMDRWVQMPVIASAAAGGVPAAANIVLPLWPRAYPGVLAAEAVLMLAVPGGLLVAVVRRRLTRTAVADLVLRLAGATSGAAVRDALREVLRDPGLEVLYWEPDGGTYVDASGAVAVPPGGPGAEAPAGRTAGPVERFVAPIATGGGDPLAVIVADPALRRHRGLVDAVLAASALALENARLQASVRAHLQRARSVHRRIAAAGASERLRLERDLHDGAQQRLLGLSARLAAARARTRDPAMLAAIEEARDEARTALRELRDLAQGIHPAALTQNGLGPALADVAERLPLPVTVDVPPVRWDAVVEGTAYFVVCEALSNAVKHSGAGRVTVCVTEEAGALTVEVADDGAGGVASSGTGMAGLGDRVRALGGEVTVASPYGEGTRVRARIPCA